MFFENPWIKIVMNRLGILDKRIADYGPWLMRLEENQRILNAQLNEILRRAEPEFDRRRRKYEQPLDAPEIPLDNTPEGG